MQGIEKMTIKTKSGITVELTPEQCDIISTALENAYSCISEADKNFLYDLSVLFHREYWVDYFNKKKNGK